MPIADRYIHNLVLRRASPGTPDRTGHTEPEFLPENYIPFKGNMQDRTGAEILGPELGGTIIANAICFANPALHVAEKDCIAQGDVLYDVKFVKALIFGSVNDHLEIGCRSIRSGLTEGGS
jgi:hypothetical protein